MNGAAAQSKIYAGYAKAAARLGLPFDAYRPSGASDPMDAGNKFATLHAHFRVDDGLKRFSTYDNPLFMAWVDGSQVQPGDYLTSTDAGTYFIAGMQPLLPILAVQCGRTVTVSRPTSATAAAALMSAWPASIVRKGSRGTDESQLPGNIANPQWEMLLPAVSGVGLDVADVVSDDLLRLYFIEQAEHSGYGWRCIIKQLPPINGSTIYHYAQVVEATGKPITFRRVTNTGGAINPVSGAITVSAAASAGASTVTLTAPVGTWALEAGDKFTIAGDATVYTVGARVVSASGKFTSVSISPALAANAAAGATVTFSWVNDYAAKGIVGAFEASLIDGTLVKIGDARILMQPTASDGRAIPKPTATDKIIMDGITRTIVTAGVQYAGSDPAVYDVQARG